MRSALRRLSVPAVIGAIVLGWSVWHASGTIQPDAIVYWIRIATLAGGAVLSIFLPHLLFPYPRFDAFLFAPPTRSGLIRSLFLRADCDVMIVLTQLVLLGILATGSSAFE